MITVLTSAATWLVPQILAHGAAFNIATTDVDNAQVNVPYGFTMRTNTSQTTGDMTSDWHIGDSTTPWLSINSVTGVLSGSPGPNDVSSGVGRSITIGVDSGNVLTDTHTYSIDIAGRMSFNFGSANPADSGAVKAGQSDVPIAQFVMQAQGEDIRLNVLRFHGIGTGSDTFDISAVKFYRDVNNNGRVDAGDGTPITTEVYDATAGLFNPTVTLNGTGASMGYVIDSTVAGGFASFLLTYDFKSTTKAATTFRATMEQATTGDISWTGLQSGYSNAQSLSGGDQNNRGTVVTTAFLTTPILAPNGIPYRSSVVTIAGDTPLAATLFVSDNGFGPSIKNVASGDQNQAALPIRFWSDSSHTIIINSITVFDSGSGVASSHIDAMKLFYDLDQDGAFSSSDLLLTSAGVTSDNVTFSNLNLTVNTPSGISTDPSAVQLLLTYSFKSTVPALTTPLKFQPIIQSTNSISAKDNVTQSAVTVVLGGDSLPGNVFEVVSGTQSSLFIDSGLGLANDSRSNSDTVAIWRGRLWTDSGHRVQVTGIRFYSTGTLDDKNDIKSIQLIKDRDNSSSFTQGDIIISTVTSYARDNDSVVMSFDEIVHTPTGVNTDSNVLRLILVYQLNGNAPVISSNPIFFSVQVLTMDDIFDKLWPTGDSVTFETGTPVNGATVSIGSVASGATGSAAGFPTLQTATFSDGDTSGTVTAGDKITLAFDTNIKSSGFGGLATDFIVPVLGDDLGAGATVSHLSGNKIQITLGTNAKLTINGTYVTGDHTADTPSGINVKDTATGRILSLYDSPAIKSASAIDIAGATGGTTIVGPRIVSATFVDADTTSSVTKGDLIVIVFDTNLATVTASQSNFVVPVLNDILGLAASAAVAQLSGNSIKITLGNSPTLTINGTYAKGTHDSGAASGIKLAATTSTITGIYGHSAVAVDTAIDIAGAVTAAVGATSSSSSSSSSTSTDTGAKVCLVTRNASPSPFLFETLRDLRDFFLTSAIGRLLVKLYYLL